MSQAIADQESQLVLFTDEDESPITSEGDPLPSERRRRNTDDLQLPPRDNPFLISPPALLSFSGGRTSALMLKLIIEAHGGHLPPGIKVCFFNTGKEREETLDFVQQCGERFGASIVWLEYDNEFNAATGKLRHGFRIVSHRTASRRGEPFAKVIEARKFLPNVVTRFCTSELKVKTGRRYMRSLGCNAWINLVGIRADEPHRIKPKRGDAGEPWIRIHPLADAGFTVDDVMDFWREQRGGMELEPWLAIPPEDRPGWDLGLRPDEGNCDLCFLKGRKKLVQLIIRRPESAIWWDEQEKKVTDIAPCKSVARFRHEYTIADLMQHAAGGEMFENFPVDPPIEDCNCTD